MLMIMHGKNKKQVKKIAIYTLLFLGSISLVSTPKSYSAFYDKDEDTLVYKAQLYNLYNESNLILEHALEDTAKLKMTFITNKAVTSGETDTYEINIPNTCKFNSVDTNATREKISDTKYIITYEGDINRDYLNTLYFTCDIDINDPKIEITAKISETIGDKSTNSPFIYSKATYSDTIDNYISQIPPDVEDSQVVPEASAYEKFVAWYEAYGKRSGYSSEVNEYVKSIFKSEADFNNKSNHTALPGLKIEYDENRKEYTFNILDNFIGYARTYYRYNDTLASPETGSATLYFSTDSKVALNTAIHEYLEDYVFPNDAEAVTLVDKYIKDKGSIYSVIFENNEFAGIECYEFNDKTNEATIRIYKEQILTIAKAAAEKRIEIAFSDYWQMISGLKDGLRTAYSDILSSDTISKIITKPDIMASITTNCTLDENYNTVTTPKKSFIDSFMYQFDNKTIIIKISTDLDNKPGYTNVEVIELEAPAGMEIAFTNTNDSEFMISISGSNKADVDKMVTDLDEYFKVTTNSSDINVTTNTSSKYSVEYKVTKTNHVRTVTTISETTSTASTTTNTPSKAPTENSSTQPNNNATDSNNTAPDTTNNTDTTTSNTSSDDTNDDDQNDQASSDNSNVNATTSNSVVTKKEGSDNDLNLDDNTADDLN